MSRRHRVHITRDLVLFTVGIAGIVNETLRSTSDRPALLALFAGMVGLPVFLRLDSKEIASRFGYSRDEEDDDDG